MHPVLVVGGGLAGLAAALRLAKAGHPVQLWEATDRLGGRVAPTPYPEIGTDDRLVDAAPAVIGFPAPWRDLFRKSGRVLDAELARTQAALVAAEPARYELADGTDLIFPTDRGEHRALHGLTRSLVANMVEGVTTGFEKRLEIQGVGYRATLTGRGLELAVGKSHPVTIDAPEGIEFEVPKPTRVTVKGINKQMVGEIAANIRKQRPPEPYKGKGIRYEGEYVARKVGKRA